MLRVSPVLSTVPRLPTSLVKASRPVSTWACKEAEFHELPKAGMSVHARRESVSSSVSLGFCRALVEKSWTCESGAHPFANASGSVVSRLLLLWQRRGCAFRRSLAGLPRLHWRPTWSVRLLEVCHLLGVVLVPESWVLLDACIGFQSCTSLLGQDRR